MQHQRKQYVRIYLNNTYYIKYMGHNVCGNRFFMEKDYTLFLT